MSESLLTECFASLTTALRRSGVDERDARWMKVASAVDEIRAVTHPELQENAALHFRYLLVFLEGKLNTPGAALFQAWENVLDAADKLKLFLADRACQRLEASAYEGDCHEVEALIAAGYDINARGSHAHNPLEACLQSVKMFGACAQLQQAIQILIDHGATVRPDHLDHVTDTAVRAMLEEAYLRQTLPPTGTPAASRLGRTSI